MKRNISIPEETEYTMALKAFNTLSPEERAVFLATVLGNENFQTDPPSAGKAIDENRFSSGLECPRCHSHHVKENGSVRKRKRYYCHACSRSFGSTTKTVAFKSKKGIAQWMQFFECMAKDMPLRSTAEYCDISLVTAFYWRHKIMRVLLDNDHDKCCTGIVEADEMYIQDNYKGNVNAYKNLKKNSPESFPDKVPVYQSQRVSGHRHGRGKATTTRGLSTQKICVPCAVDRSGRVIGIAAGKGNVSAEYLHYAFDGKIDAQSILITDGAKATPVFSSDLSLTHKALKSDSESRTGIFNLQRINNVHSSVSSLLAKYKNIGTRYLDNYLGWASWKSEHPGLTQKGRSQALLKEVLSSYTAIDFATIRAMPIVPYPIKI